MLRSNPSVRADARAWGAVLFLPLLITLHAWARPAINLLHLSSAYSPLAEPPWLPFGKISAAATRQQRGGRRAGVSRNLPENHPAEAAFADLDEIGAAGL
jgi:hypothetical protein